MNDQKQFRIGYVAQLLGVQRFVIRFWEKEFDLKGYRTNGGQRFYKQKEIEKFKLIQTLLYEKKFTIAGAKKIILEQNQKEKKTHLLDKKDIKDDFLDKIKTLREKLIKLQNLLQETRLLNHDTKTL